MDKKLVDKIEKYILLHKDEIIDRLMDFVKIPSVVDESNSDEQSPYGENCRLMIDYVAEAFKSHNFDASVSEKGHYATADISCNGKKTIGIFAHSDVVPAGDGWILTDNPFLPVIKDGCIVGRGVEDNKSALVISLYVPKILNEIGITLKSNYSVFIGSAEETGMSDIDKYLKDKTNIPDICIVLDGAFPVCNGESSICRFHAISGIAFDSIAEFDGGLVYNAILDKLNVKIKYSDALYKSCIDISEKSNGEIIVSKNGDEICITALGITKHAAMPEGGKNAAEVFAYYFKNNDFISETDQRLLKDIELLTGDMWGERLGISHNDGIGRLTFVNGICKKRNDGRADLSFDIRHSCNLKGEELMRRIDTALAKLGWSCDYTEYFEQSAGYTYSADDKYLNLFTDIYNNCAYLSGCADCNAKPYYSAGGTYARKLKNAYTVGTNAHYIPDIQLNLPSGHGGVHQKDEYIQIDRFLEAIKVLTVMVAEIDKEINKEDMK